MARDALCAPRVWDAAEPEVIHPRAFTKDHCVCRPAGRSEYGEVLLYFRPLDPLERCEEQCTFATHPRPPVLRHRHQTDSALRLERNTHVRVRTRHRSSMSASACEHAPHRWPLTGHGAGPSGGRIALASSSVAVGVHRGVHRDHTLLFNTVHVVGPNAVLYTLEEGVAGCV